VLDTDSHLLDCAAIIEGDGSSSPSKAPYARGHRRRSTHVTRRDLEKFQKEVLGVENHASFYDEENGTSRPITPNDPQLDELNRAFTVADLSMNNTAGMTANGSASGMFSGYADSSQGNPNMGSAPRQSMSPALSHPAAQVNGGGMGSFAPGMPMNAGHQMDLHHLYDMVLELSDVLKNNREVTKNIVSSAEDIMVCRRTASECRGELEAYKYDRNMALRTMPAQPCSESMVKYQVCLILSILSSFLSPLATQIADSSPRDSGPNFRTRTRSRQGEATDRGTQTRTSRECQTHWGI
jgi:hypothetical protein